MPNYSLLSIPAMWLTAQVPHAYAVSLVKRANNNRFDNANSKGSAFQAALKTSVPAATLARYERAEAAHRNGMENLPFFAAAVLAAKWAGVGEGAVAATAAVYLALRVLYNGLYIHVTSQKKSFARTGVWVVSMVVALSLFVRAAVA